MELVDRGNVMGWMRASAIGCAAAACFAMGGCFDLAKSHASWTRSDKAAMSSDSMTLLARGAFRDAGLTPRDGGGGRIQDGLVWMEPTGSSTFAWRQGVWLCTGAPVGLAATIPLNLLANPLVTNNKTIYLVPGNENVTRKLQKDSLSICFKVEDLSGGLTKGTCTVSAVGMSNKARHIKESLWRELDKRFLFEKVGGSPGSGPSTGTH
jgi:hypothetical protein